MNHFQAYSGAREPVFGAYPMFSMIYHFNAILCQLKTLCLVPITPKVKPKRDNSMNRHHYCPEGEVYKDVNCRSAWNYGSLMYQSARMETACYCSCCATGHRGTQILRLLMLFILVNCSQALWLFYEHFISLNRDFVVCCALLADISLRCCQSVVVVKPLQL